MGVNGHMTVLLNQTRVIIHGWGFKEPFLDVLVTRNEGSLWLYINYYLCSSMVCTKLFILKSL